MVSSQEKGPKSQMAPETPESRDAEAAKEEANEEAADEKKEQEEESRAEGNDVCNDDAVWTDPDGDGCGVYADYIKQGKLTVAEACTYGVGHAKNYCRKTCNTCKAAALATTCEDKQCVTRWRYERGKCYACDEWKNFCNKDFFAHDCPRTCGLCQADGLQTTPPLPVTQMPTTTVVSTMPPTNIPTAQPKCKDHQCVDSWLKRFGVCHKCKDFAEDYCGRDEEFMKSCPKSCKMCKSSKLACHDDFLPHTCKRYAEWGWCSTPHISKHCKASCGVCATMLKIEEKTPAPTLFPGGAAHMVSSPLWVGLLAALCFSTLTAPAA